MKSLKLYREIVQMLNYGYPTSEIINRLNTDIDTVEIVESIAIKNMDIKYIF